MIDFSRTRAVVMDMDGVLWRGDESLPGVDAWFAFLRARDLRFALATNNSSKAPSDYVNKLAALGIDGVQPQQIVTSGTAALDYVRERYPVGTPLYILGGDGLKAMMTAEGYPLTETGAHAVVVGIDWGLTYDKLRTAARLIRQGAEFIGTNDDATFPMPDGLSPGAGSILAALRTATDVQPVVMGKPNAPMFTAALHALDIEAGHALMIGDRLNTDIAGAKRVGLQTALVLTGVSTRADLDALPADEQPDGVYDDLNALRTAWLSSG